MQRRPMYQQSSGNNNNNNSSNQADCIINGTKDVTVYLSGVVSAIEICLIRSSKNPGKKEERLDSLSSLNSSFEVIEFASQWSFLIEKVEVFGFSLHRLPNDEASINLMNQMPSLRGRGHISEVIEAEILLGFSFLAAHKFLQAKEVFERCLQPYLSLIQTGVASSHPARSKAIQIYLAIANTSRSNGFTEKIFAFQKAVDVYYCRTSTLAFSECDYYTRLIQMKSDLVQVLLVCLSSQKDSVRVSAVDGIMFLLDTLGCTIGDLLPPIIERLAKTFPNEPIEEDADEYSCGVYEVYHRVFEQILSVISSASSDILRKIFVDVVSSRLFDESLEFESRVYLAKIALKIIGICQGDLILSPNPDEFIMNFIETLLQTNEAVWNQYAWKVWDSMKSRVLSNLHRNTANLLLKAIAEVISDNYSDITSVELWLEVSQAILTEKREQVILPTAFLNTLKQESSDYLDTEILIEPLMKIFYDTLLRPDLAFLFPIVWSILTRILPVAREDSKSNDSLNALAGIILRKLREIIAEIPLSQMQLSALHTILASLPKQQKEEDQELQSEMRLFLLQFVRDLSNIIFEETIQVAEDLFDRITCLSVSDINIVLIKLLDSEYTPKERSSLRTLNKFASSLMCGQSNQFKALLDACFLENREPKKEAVRYRFDSKIYNENVLNFHNKIGFFIKCIESFEEKHFKVWIENRVAVEQKIIDLVSSKDSSIRLKGCKVLRSILDRYCALEGKQQPDSGTSTAIKSSENEQSQQQSREYFTFQSVSIASGILNCLNRMLSDSLVSDPKVQFNSLLLLESVFTILLSPPSLEQEMEFHMNYQPLGNSSGLMEQTIDIMNQIDDPLLQNLKLKSQEYLEIRLQQVLNFWKNIEKLLDSPWSNIKSLIHSIFSNWVRTDLRHYNPILQKKLLNRITKLIGKLLMSEDSESRTGGLNIIGSLCGLSYDFSDEKYSVELKKPSEFSFFRRHENMIPLQIWQSVQKMQSDWDMTNQAASMVLIQVCAPKQSVVHFHRQNQERRSMNKNPRNSTKGASQPEVFWFNSCSLKEVREMVSMFRSEQKQQISLWIERESYNTELKIKQEVPQSSNEDHKLLIHDKDETTVVYQNGTQVKPQTNSEIKINGQQIKQQQINSNIKPKLENVQEKKMISSPQKEKQPQSQLANNSSDDSDLPAYPIERTQNSQQGMTNPQVNNKNNNNNESKINSQSDQVSNKGETDTKLTLSNNNNINNNQLINEAQQTSNKPSSQEQQSTNKLQQRTQDNPTQNGQQQMQQSQSLNVGVPESIQTKHFELIPQIVPCSPQLNEFSSDGINYPKQKKQDSKKESLSSDQNIQNNTTNNNNNNNNTTTTAKHGYEKEEVKQIAKPILTYPMKQTQHEDTVIINTSKQETKHRPTPTDATTTTTPTIKKQPLNNLARTLSPMLTSNTWAPPLTPPPQKAVTPTSMSSKESNQNGFLVLKKQAEKRKRNSFEQNPQTISTLQQKDNDARKQKAYSPSTPPVKDQVSTFGQQNELLKHLLSPPNQSDMYHYLYQEPLTDIPKKSSRNSSPLPSPQLSNRTENNSLVKKPSAPSQLSSTKKAAITPPPSKSPFLQQKPTKTSKDISINTNELPQQNMSQNKQNQNQQNYHEIVQMGYQNNLAITPSLAKPPLRTSNPQLSQLSNGKIATNNLSNKAFEINQQLQQAWNPKLKKSSNPPKSGEQSQQSSSEHLSNISNEMKLNERNSGSQLLYFQGYTDATVSISSKDNNSNNTPSSSRILKRRVSETGPTNQNTSSSNSSITPIINNLFQDFNSGSLEDPLQQIILQQQLAEKREKGKSSDKLSAKSSNSNSNNNSSSNSSNSNNKKKKKRSHSVCGTGKQTSKQQASRIQNWMVERTSPKQRSSIEKRVSDSGRKTTSPLPNSSKVQQLNSVAEILKLNQSLINNVAAAHPSNQQKYVVNPKRTNNDRGCYSSREAPVSPCSTPTEIVMVQQQVQTARQADNSVLYLDATNRMQGPSPFFDPSLFSFTF